MKELILRLAMETVPSGSERPFSEVLLKELGGLEISSHVDALGNLIVTKTGDGPHVMLAVHADEPGVMVIDVDDDGFLRILSVGTLAVSELIGRTVRFTNGEIGLISLEEGVKTSEATYDHLFVDIAATDQADALRRISIGLSGAVGSDVQEVTANRWVGRALDNRVGCAIAILAFRELASRGRQVTVAFTAQHTVGSRGAQTAAYQVRPDLALVIDAAPASDVPGGKRTSLSLGQGPAIKIMDGTAIVPLTVKNLLQTVAEREQIAIQHEVWPGGHSDAGAVQLSVDGILIGGVSYPARYVGGALTMIDLEDAKQTLDLVVATALEFA